MRSYALLLVAAFGCNMQPDEPTPMVEATPMERNAVTPEPGSDVSLSLEVNDDGGSIDASTDANGTSVDAKVDVDADAAKKKRGN